MKALINIEGTTSTTIKRLVRDDYGWPISFTIQYDNGGVVDLTGATVKFKMKPTAEGSIMTVTTNDANSLTLGDAATSTEKRGFRIIILNDCTLRSVTKITACTATRAQLLDDGTQALIATASFVGNDAVFDPQPTLIAGEYYRITVDANGAMYNEQSETGVTYPLALTNISYTAGVYGSTGQSTSSTLAYNILSIATDVETETPGLKINGTCTLTDETRGVCEYELQAGDLDTAGNYDAELEITLPGPDVRTIKLGKVEVLEDLT